MVDHSSPKSFRSPKLALFCLSFLLLFGGKIQAQATTTAEVIDQIERLGSSNRRHRLAAVQTLKKIGSPAVSVLVEALNDSDVNVRKNAAFALGSMGSDGVEAVPTLLSTLKDSSSEVRMNVAVALRNITPASPAVQAQAIEELTAALQHEEATVRQGAAFGLGILGPVAHAAIPDLITTLKDSDEQVSLKAAIALKRMGQPAVAALTEALNHPDMQVRAKAAFALGKIKASIVPDMTAALQNTERQIRQTAAQSLEKLSSPQLHLANRPIPGTNRPTPGGNRPTPRPGRSGYFG